MSDYYSAIIATDLDCDAIFDRMESQLPDLRWRRGESEMQGARTVSGRNDLGAFVKYWLYESDTSQAEVEISLRGAKPDAAGSTAWQDALVSRLFDEVFADLGSVTAINDEPIATTDSGASRQGTIVESGAEIVLDLNEWLPPSGEDGVSVSPVDNRLEVTVDYLPDEGGPMQSRTVVFDGVAYHLKEAVPGESALAGSFSNKDIRPGEVADLGQTGFLQDWKAAPEESGRETAGADQPPRHFFVLFWEMGIAVHVLAAEVSLR